MEGVRGVYIYIVVVGRQAIENILRSIPGLPLDRSMYLLRFLKASVIETYID